jgi:hypothetical protein
MAVLGGKLSGARGPARYPLPQPCCSAASRPKSTCSCHRHSCGLPLYSFALPAISIRRILLNPPPRRRRRFTADSPADSAASASPLSDLSRRSYLDQELMRPLSFPALLCPRPPQPAQIGAEEGGAPAMVRVVAVEALAREQAVAR